MANPSPPAPDPMASMNALLDAIKALTNKPAAGVQPVQVTPAADPNAPAKPAQIAPIIPPAAPQQPMARMIDLMPQATSLTDSILNKGQMMPVQKAQVQAGAGIGGGGNGLLDLISGKKPDAASGAPAPTDKPTGTGKDNKLFDMLLGGDSAKNGGHDKASTILSILKLFA